MVKRFVCGIFSIRFDGFSKSILGNKDVICVRICIDVLCVFYRRFCGIGTDECDFYFCR